MNKDELNVAIGRRIRQTRENMGYTRENFSELCDISDSFLSDIERGNKSLTTKTLYKICTASHISADYLLFGTIPESCSKNSQIESMLSTLSSMSTDQRSHAAAIINEFFLALHGL